MDESELHTIDPNALNEIFCQEIPSNSAIPEPCSPGPVTDELLRSCVTPRKVVQVRDALETETERHKLAIRLLQLFFTKEELATGNTDGHRNKFLLDRSRLHSLKGIPTETSFSMEH